MANHALPTTTSLYTDVLTNLKDRIDDSLKMLDSVNTTPTSVPTNSIRWNSTSNIWEKYNGSSWVALTATYSIATLKATNLLGGNNTNLLGSIPYQSNTDTTTLLAPNTTTTRKFLRQTGTGTNGAVPVWDTILAADVPTLNQNTTGSAASLTTARTINGVSFNGTANINIEDRLGTAIASAATTTIGTAGLGETIHITGTTTITSFGTAATAGIRRTLIFDGALTITHNATSLICVGGVSIVTVAGTVIEVVAETTANWRVVSITHPSLSMTELGYLDGVTSAIQTQINGKAPLASPAFTGTPTAPTATAGTNTTQIATTAFVLANTPTIADASETVKGIVELATNAEVQTGADTTRAVTSAGLKSSLGVLNANLGFGAVGSYALLIQTSLSASIVTAGQTYAGSGLRYSGFASLSAQIQGTTGTDQISGATPSGTWMAMGTMGSTSSIARATLFLRVA